MGLQRAHGLGRERPGDAQLGNIHAEEGGALVAVDEVALGADPEFALAIGADVGDAGMGLDVALMGLLGPERSLHDHLGLPESGVDVAMTELAPLGNVGRPGGLRLDAVGEDAVVDDGS